MRKSAWLLCLALAGAAGAWSEAKEVGYVGAEGEWVVQECTMAESGSTTWSGWMAASGWVVIPSRVQVSGDVNLVLCDGALLSATNGGIRVKSGASLTVWGQWNGHGKLTAWGDADCAGIGGNDGESGGKVVVYGGMVEAWGGEYGAGIGGGDRGDGGTVEVHGGEVAAYGYEGGAGIGGGDYGNGGAFTITGGKVTAQGGRRRYGKNGTGQAAAGIGAGRPDIDKDGNGGVVSGQHRTSGTVSILGGEVVAKAGEPVTNAAYHFPDPAQAMGVNSKDAEWNEANNANWLTVEGAVAVYTSAAAAEPVPAAERGAACRGTNAWVKACPHRPEGLVCAWCGAIVPPPLPGKGTKEEPYLIGDYGTLVAFAMVVNGTHPSLGADAGAWARLTDDIAAEGTFWMGIGDGEHFYNGTFDGCGHAVSGLSNEGLAEAPACAGLFGAVGASGNVRNVKVDGAALQGSEKTGGIAGWNKGRVTGCCTTGGKVSGGEAGGIAGRNDGRVADCHGTGAVEGASRTAGGIAGRNSGTVENCHSTSDLHGHGGGIAGTHEAGTLENCHWSEEGLQAVDDVGSEAVIAGCGLLTEAQYGDPANYAGWDFKRTWRMEGGMPVLRAFGGAMAVTGVSAGTPAPWNPGKNEGFVELTFVLSEDLGLTGEEVALRVTATDLGTGETWEAAEEALSGDTGTAAGAHTVRWNWLAQGIAPGATNVAFRVEYTWREKALYCVADLSGGADAAAYPVEYLTAEPEGGFNRDEFKTEKLVLRRIDPTNDWNNGTFMMGLGGGGAHKGVETRLTNAYYIGVFETTQKQWELVEGWTDCYFDNEACAATRPVEMVSFLHVRGENEGTNWPSSSAVDARSFAGKLRARTGLGFDLPTEAQWEFACRAGTETDFNSGKDMTGDDRDEGLDGIGRYRANSGAPGNIPDHCGTEYGTAAAGSYAPNRWGLYDMHGNVDELCLDYYRELLPGGVEPAGPESSEGDGDYRVARGGSFYSSPRECASWARRQAYMSAAVVETGFRLCIPGAGVGWAATTACAGECAGVAVWPEYEEEVGEATWTYRAEPGATHATVTGASSAEGAVELPSTLGGLPVSEIAAGAFAGCAELTKLVIPDGVESVGEGAFGGSGLVELSVPGAWKGTAVLDGAGVPEGCQVVYREEKTKVRVTGIGVGGGEVTLSFDREASVVYGTTNLNGSWEPLADYRLDGTNATISLEKAYRFLRAE